MMQKHYVDNNILNQNTIKIISYKKRTSFLNVMEY